MPALLEIFALSMIDDWNVKMSVLSQPEDASDAVRVRISEPLGTIHPQDGDYPASLEILEWKRLSSRSLQLCTETRIPLLPAGTRTKVSGDYNSSAYINRRR